MASCLGEDLFKLGLSSYLYLDFSGTPDPYQSRLQLNGNFCESMEIRRSALLKAKSCVLLLGAKAPVIIPTTCRQIEV